MARDDRTGFVVGAVMIGAMVVVSALMLGSSGGFAEVSERAESGDGYFAFVLGFCVLLALGLYLRLIRPYLKRRRLGFAVDEHGIWWVDRDEASLLAWPDIAGVGCGFVKVPWTRFSLYSPHQRDLHVEVYLHQMTRARHRHLAELWGVEEEAAHPHMPRIRLRFGEVAPVMMEEFANAVREHDARRWLGLRQ